MNPGFWYDSPALHTYPIHSKHLRVTPLWFINVVIHSFKEFEFEFIGPKMYLSDKYRASLLQSAKLPPDCKKNPKFPEKTQICVYYYLVISVSPGWNLDWNPLKTGSDTERETSPNAQTVSVPLRDAWIEHYCYIFLSDVCGALGLQKTTGWEGQLSKGPLAF